MAQSKFHHEEIYRGADLVQKLSAYHLTICGAGAIGSNLAETLARQGFSHLKVIDKDRVETHNLNTQIYGQPQIGATKTAALEGILFRSIGTAIEPVHKELTAANAKSLLKDSSLVIDAFDNSLSRQLVQDGCRARVIPLLHAGLFEDYGEVCWDVGYRVPKDTAQGDVCDYALARNLVMLVVAIAAEEIIDHCLADKPRHASWSLTLKDLAIRKL